MKSQNSQRSSGRIEDMSEEQLDSAVLKVMFYLLSDMRNMKKVRKEEIVTNVLEKSSRQYATIMKRVEHNLSKTFGLLLVKLPDANDAFIIVNKHQSKFIELTKDLNTTSDVQENLILTIVLSAIFMNRGQMYESKFSLLSINAIWITFISALRASIPTAMSLIIVAIFAYKKFQSKNVCR